MPHVRRQFFPFFFAFVPLAIFAAEPSTPTNPRFTGTPPLRVWRMDEMGASLFNARAHEMGTAAVNWRADSAGVHRAAVTRASSRGSRPARR